MNTQSIIEAIKSFCGDDEEGATEMLQLIKKSVSESVVELDTLHMGARSKDISSIVHKLRFTFSVIGAIDLAEMAASIEESVVENKVNTETFDLYEKFKVKFAHLNTILNEMP